MLFRSKFERVEFGFWAKLIRCIGGGDSRVRVSKLSIYGQILTRFPQDSHSERALSGPKGLISLSSLGLSHGHAASSPCMLPSLLSTWAASEASATMIGNSPPVSPKTCEEETRARGPLVAHKKSLTMAVAMLLAVLAGAR